jgi:PPOX class probable F420-dependent enzyme
MSRRDEIVMTEKETKDLLQHARVMILTSLGRDGLPHPMPMFYGIESDGSVVMSTYTKSQKILNLKRDPRVSLLVEDGATYNELRGVVLYGKAELVPDTDDVMRMIAVVASRGGEASDDSEAALAGRRRMASKRTGIRIRPERIVSWDHAKIAG